MNGCLTTATLIGALAPTTDWCIGPHLRAYIAQWERCRSDRRETELEDVFPKEQVEREERRRRQARKAREKEARQEEGDG